MPVAKLSRNFYEKFGDELTDELVNCLNSIEATYRLELRDLFDAHFGRFEAKLEQRLAEFKADIEGRSDQRFGALELSIERVRVELHREIGSVAKWNFAVWIPIALAIIGLYFKP